MNRNICSLYTRFAIPPITFVLSKVINESSSCPGWCTDKSIKKLEYSSFRWSAVCKWFSFFQEIYIKSPSNKQVLPSSLTISQTLKIIIQITICVRWMGDTTCYYASVVKRQEGEWNFQEYTQHIITHNSCSISLHVTVTSDPDPDLSFPCTSLAVGCLGGWLGQSGSPGTRCHL